MSLRSDGYVPKMVKAETGDTVEVCEGIAEARGKLTEVAGSILDWVTTFGSGDYWGPVLGKVSAANALLGITSTVEIPSIVEAGFTTKPKLDFWRREV